MYRSYLYRWTGLLSLVPAALFSAAVLAEPAYEPIPPILITPSRLPESAEETLFSTDVVTREDIVRSQARDVSEVLRNVPGVEIGRNGGAGQATSLFIRGTASDHTLVLVDGVPINSGTVGSAAVQHLMPEQFDRIEVVRGPGSTLYGSSAIGGVVQLFTPRPGPGGSGGATFEAGSEGSGRVTASGGYGGDTFRAGATLSRRVTDGYPVRPSLSSLDRGYENDSFGGNVGARFGNVDIEVSHLQADGLVEYVDFFGSPVDQDTENSVTRLALETSPTSDWDSRLLVARTVDEIDENQSDDFAHTDRDYVDWQNTYRLDDKQTLVGGFTGSWTDTELLSFGSGYDERIRSLELYLQDTIEFGDTRLQIGGRAIDNEKYGDNYTWQIAAGHRVNDATRVHANIGTAFRAPSANDLYGFGGNPDFDPEESIGGELGLDYAIDRRNQVRAVAFYTEINDLIETDPVSFVTEQVEEARIRGIELGFAHRSANWRASLDYTYQDPKNRDQDQLLARRARNIVNAALRYDRPQWWSEATLKYASERRDSRFSDAVLDEYTVVGIVAGYRFGRGFSISGRVDNLFDEDYELAATYPAQGRFISVQLRYDINGPGR